MPSKPHKRLKIDVRALNKAHFFEGKEHATKTMILNGKTVPYRPLYADITLWENEQPDDYGQDGFLSQDVGKEARERGEKGPIIGNTKPIAPKPATRSEPPPPPANDDDLPW
jgi:hypothetical protein